LINTISSIIPLGQAARDSADQIQAQQQEQGSAAPPANKNSLVPPKLQYPFEVRFAATVAKDNTDIVKTMRDVREKMKLITLGDVCREFPIRDKLKFSETRIPKISDSTCDTI
jgi:hypothetical protein